MALVHDEHTDSLVFSDTTVFGIVRAIVAFELGLDEDLVTLEAKFAEDLNADSLNLVEMVMSLEEILQERGFTLYITDSEAEQLDCAGEVVRFLKEKGFTDHYGG